MIGEVVGTYRIVSMLGAGGMGAVWLAEHTLLGRRVAIKFLHAEVSRSEAMVERFFAEARAATRIADPGIIVVYDFGWHTDGSAYIVMEYLGGESIATRLRHGPFSVVEAVRVIQQSALAMAVAHAAGIIHRDLKPDNIFLVRDPAVPGGERVKILDFGIAKLVGADHGNPTLTRTGAIMGTPTYMSPEQCRGASDIDHRTDIYALGCVLFHLLCGRVPFAGATPGDLIAAHLLEAPVPPSALAPRVPREIDAIVLRCLAKAADDRFSTMTELVRALGAAVGSDGWVPTIPPNPAMQRASTTPPPQTSDELARRAPQAALLSTLASSAGQSAAQSIARPPRGRALRIGVGVAAFAAVAIAAVVAITNRPAAQPDPADARIAVPGDAAAAPDTAAAAASVPVPPPIDAGAPIDAAPRVDAGVRVDAPPRPRPRPRPGSGSAAPNCELDPYACP